MTDRRRSVGSWMEGARAAGVDLGRPGERLGLPAEGPGSVAGYGRRIAALIVDWLMSLLLATFLTAALHWNASARGLVTLGIFGVLTWLSTGLTGTTPGKRLCGLRVTRTGGRPPGPLWAFVRTVLLLVVIPAVLWDRDHRGLHDRAADTVVVAR